MTACVLRYLLVGVVASNAFLLPDIMLIELALGSSSTLSLVRRHSSLGVRTLSSSELAAALYIFFMALGAVKSFPVA
jgi:hypothetical protein